MSDRESIAEWLERKANGYEVKSKNEREGLVARLHDQWTAANLSVLAAQIRKEKDVEDNKAFHKARPQTGNEGD